MMQYEVVTLEEKTIVGYKTHTGNADSACAEKIGILWDRFMRAPLWQQFMQPGQDAPCYGLYTNYGEDGSSYDAAVGCECADHPADLTEICIPAGKYAKFHFHGDVRMIPCKAWSEIWAMTLPRAFAVDFEAYTNFADGAADIDIYVGLTD